MPAEHDVAAPRAPRLLALDCATERLAVAVVDGASTWCADEDGGATASSRLLPCIFEQLARAGLNLRDLDAVAFGRGPGAFTGLRGACAVAQGLAFGAGLAVLPIDSLAIVAEGAWQAQGAAASRLWVAMDARLEGVYAAAYRREGDAWLTEEAPALWSVDALADHWRRKPPPCVAGTAVAAYSAQLAAGAAVSWPTPVARAAALASLARTAWQRGQALPANQALPLYLRDKVALTTAERAAAAQAAATAAALPAAPPCRDLGRGMRTLAR